MTVAVLMLTCSIFGAAFMTLHFTAGTGLGLFAKGALLTFFLISFFAPLLTFDRSGHGSGILYSLYYHTLYTLFVTAYLLLMLLIVREVCWKTLYWLSDSANPLHQFLGNRAIIRKADLITLAIAALTGLYALYSGMRVPPLRELTLYTPKITEPITLVALADLHLHRTLPLSKLRGIVEAANALEPDLILLPGDTLDDQAENIAPHLDLLRGLRARRGTYAVAGNHDLYVGERMTEKALRTAGITWLENAGASITPGLYLAGVPYRGTATSAYDPHSKVDYPAAFANRTGSPYTLLLAHTPKEAKRIPEGEVDLMLAGHTHGGQVFPFHLISWKLNDFFLQGLYSIGSMQLYVSRGSGQWGPQLRLFAPSEITVIHLKPEREAVKTGN